MPAPRLFSGLQAHRIVWRKQPSALCEAWLALLAAMHQALPSELAETIRRRRAPASASAAHQCTETDRGMLRAKPTSATCAVVVCPSLRSGSCALSSALAVRCSVLPAGKISGLFRMWQKRVLLFPLCVSPRQRTALPLNTVSGAPRKTSRLTIFNKVLRRVPISMHCAVSRRGRSL